MAVVKLKTLQKLKTLETKLFEGFELVAGNGVARSLRRSLIRGGIYQQNCVRATRASLFFYLHLRFRAISTIVIQSTNGLARSCLAR